MVAFVTLKGGLIAPEPALKLALALESRGHALSTIDGKLNVTNGSALTADDRAAITQWKRHLMALATYDAPEHG